MDCDALRLHACLGFGVLLSMYVFHNDGMEYGCMSMKPEGILEDVKVSFINKPFNACAMTQKKIISRIDQLKEKEYFLNIVING